MLRDALLRNAPQHEGEKTMRKKYPGRMTFTQWRRTPFRVKHWLIGIAINDHFGYWRDCKDARCRRARSCQDYRCYWRRLHALPTLDEQSRVRSQTKPWQELLSIGSIKGFEGMPLY
jgi:hypothetical protein